MVKDASGNGIQGVDVKVDNKVIGKTDDQGKLESNIKYLLDEVITIEASKDGFRTGLVTNKVRGLTNGESSEIVVELKSSIGFTTIPGCSSDESQINFKSVIWKNAPFENKEGCETACDSASNCDFYIFDDAVSAPGQPNCFCGDFQVINPLPITGNTLKGTYDIHLKNSNFSFFDFKTIFLLNFHFRSRYL